MKSGLTIVSTSRTLELIKRPKPKNIHSGRVCVSKKEIQQVWPNDVITLKVLDSDDNIVATKTFTSKQFHAKLKVHEINNRGWVISYHTLSYT